MEVAELHGWRLTPAAAMALQRELAGRVLKDGGELAPRFIAGVDVAAGVRQKLARGAVVVLSYPELELVEKSVVEGSLDFPYIPGLLSFRELPLVLRAFKQLEVVPDLVLVDGQGLAHPRRMGIACHLGLFLDRPTVGCAKSRLCGSHRELGEQPGDCAPLTDGGEVIGVALRTRVGVKPLYVSIGHKTSLEAAIFWVLRCLRGYRLPEPTRLAHQAAGGNLGRSGAGQKSLSR